MKHTCISTAENNEQEVRFIHKDLLNHIKSKMHVKKAITATYKSNTLKLFMTFYKEEDIPKHLKDKKAIKPGSRSL